MNFDLNFIAKPIPTFYNDLSPLTVQETHPVGSRWTCDPAPTDTDEDTLVLLNKSTVEGQSGTLDFAKYLLVKAGWECSAEYEQERWGEAPFLTARKGDQNLILYVDPVGYGRFIGAACCCKALNLTQKPDRVVLHRAATEHDYFTD